MKGINSFVLNSIIAFAMKIALRYSIYKISKEHPMRNHFHGDLRKILATCANTKPTARLQTSAWQSTVSAQTPT